jgi:hypothetical protein
VDNGLPVDITIYDYGDRNLHAHILIPTRCLETNRFSKYKVRDLNPIFANRYKVCEKQKSDFVLTLLRNTNHKSRKVSKEGPCAISL